jgi:hypothetical protein
VRVNKHFFLYFLLFFLCSHIASGQRDKVENLPKYYRERLQLGFTIGYNQSNFIISPVRDFHLLDSLKAVESIPGHGFNLGLIIELRLHDYFTMRVVPDLSFAARSLNYYFETSKDTFWLRKDIESTFLDFPVDFKLRSARLNNFSAYIVAGGKYTYDIASNKNVQSNNNNAPLSQMIVKLDRSDFAYQGGAGIEFYLPYFKLAIEGKLAAGLKNTIVRDGSILSNPIEKLRSKVFLLSITFEG